MDDLDMEGDAAGARSEPARKRKRKAVSRATWRARFLHVPEKSPEAHPGSTGIRKVKVVSKKAQWRLHIIDVPWAVEYIASEVACNGVARREREDPVAREESRGVYFDHRDRAWQVTVRRPSGELVRRTFCIGKVDHTTRKPLHVDGYMQKKAEAHKAAVMFMQQVKQGDV